MNTPTLTSILKYHMQVHICTYTHTHTSLSPLLFLQVHIQYVRTYVHHSSYIYIIRTWVFPKIMVPQNGWFIIMVPNPMNKWMIWGGIKPPLFLLRATHLLRLFHPKKSLNPWHLDQELRTSKSPPNMWEFLGV